MRNEVKESARRPKLVRAPLDPACSRVAVPRQASQSCEELRSWRLSFAAPAKDASSSSGTVRSNRLVGLQAAPLLRALSALLRTSSRVLQRHADVVLSAHCRERRSCGELGSCSSRSGLSFRSQTSRGARCVAQALYLWPIECLGCPLSERRARAAPAARETSTTSVRTALSAALRALLPF